ncbi:MAG: PQQ-binding-like beta-propeller repeat protein, partial [Bdellovibrionales bacterium]|nr:PQQ-binding-like beta-propeller repeat protein [Bdellovibrionales bacterium]
AKGPLKQVHQRTFGLNGVNPFSSYSTSFSMLSVDQSERLYFGTESGKIVCMDGRSGKKLWVVSVDGHSIDTEVLRVGGTELYVGTAKGYVYRYDISPTQKRPERTWALELDGQPRGKLLHHNGHVFVGSNIGYLYALTEDGALAWKYKYQNVDSEMSIRNFAKPLTTKGHIFFSNSKGDVIGIDSTGSLLWKKSIPQLISLKFKDISDLSWISEDILLVSSFEGKSAIFSSKGELIQVFDREGTSAQPLFSEKDGSWLLPGVKALQKIDRESYLYLWEWPLDKATRWSGFISSEKEYLASTVSGWLYVLDPQEKKIRWKYKVGRSIQPGMVKLGEKIWVLSSGGHILAFERRGQ